MTYTIVGNDGKKYGPAGAEQLRQWIRQGRVESRTPVYVPGAADWTFLGLLPEFAAEFSGTPPTISPPGQIPFPGAGLPAGTNQLAVWGFICGLLGWTCCGCCAPVSIVGLVFSIIALTQINARSGTDGRGFAIAGIVLSATNLLWSLGLGALSLLNNTPQVQWNLGN